MMLTRKLCAVAQGTTAWCRLGLPIQNELSSHSNTIGLLSCSSW